MSKTRMKTTTGAKGNGFPSRGGTRVVILLGLTLAYIIFFELIFGQVGHLASILLALPVIAAGVFFGRTAGLAAGLAGFLLNLLLLTRFGNEALAQTLRYWLGYLAIGVLGYLAGYFYDAALARKQADLAVDERERFIVLTRMAAGSIVGSKSPDEGYFHLVSHLTNMFVADYAYLIRWNEARKQAVLIATTLSLEKPFSPVVLGPEESGMVEEMSQFESPRFVDDVQSSAYLINPSPFKDLALRTKSALTIPLSMKGYCFGVAILGFDSPRRFSQDELTYVELAGNQITLALRTIQQQVEIEAKLKEAQALANIERALSKTERVGTDEVLQLIVDSALDLIENAEEGVIHLLDAEQDTLVPRAISGFDAGAKASMRYRIGLKEGVAGHVIASGETINIGDIHASSLFVIKDTAPTYRSLLVAPVQSGDQPVGTISVQSNRLDAFSVGDVELLNSLSIQAAIALENARLFEATQKSLKEVNALYLTGQGLASSLDTDELIQDVVNLLQQNFGYSHAQIFLMDPISGDLVLKSGSGEIGARLLEMNYRLPRGTGVVGHAVETATPFVTNNVNAVMFFFRNPLLPDTQSEITVPIKVDGKVVGVLDIQDTPPRRLTDNDLQLMIAVADQLSVALQKASIYTNLQTSLQQEQSVRTQLIQSERLALVGRLLASVSHELNNPLQAIQNALFLLKDEEHLSPEGKQDLDVILSEAERMASLIERLRSAYRPGRVKDFRPVELNNLIEDVHTLISTHMRHKQIAFEFHPDPDLPPVSGMSDQMRQVVLNLFLNAIEAMGPGGRLTARTLSLPQQNEILLTVQDTGPGIAPDILPKVFDAFITDKQTGTGLGLTITRDIIEQHFGRIEAANDPAGGAVFSIWLPTDGKGRE
jgi:signal transduction histidine kinase